MTVIDSSGVVDYLLDGDAAPAVDALLDAELGLVAPDVVVFEVLAVFRRGSLRGAMPAARAEGAIGDLGDVSLDLFPSITLRRRAWELRENFSAADALFVSLAELLDEPLATKDKGLLEAASQRTKIETIDLS